VYSLGCSKQTTGLAKHRNTEMANPTVSQSTGFITIIAFKYFGRSEIRYIVVISKFYGLWYADLVTFGHSRITAKLFALIPFLIVPSKQAAVFNYIFCCTHMWAVSVFNKHITQNVKEFLYLRWIFRYIWTKNTLEFLEFNVSFISFTHSSRGLQHWGHLAVCYEFISKSQNYHHVHMICITT